MIYSITQDTSTDLKSCYGTPKFAIDDTGAVLVRDTLYTHLDGGGPRIEFDGQQSLCDYNIVVNDTIQNNQVEAKVRCFHFRQIFSGVELEIVVSGAGGGGGGLNSPIQFGNSW